MAQFAGESTAVENRRTRESFDTVSKDPGPSARRRLILAPLRPRRLIVLRRSWLARGSAAGARGCALAVPAVASADTLRCRRDNGVLPRLVGDQLPVGDRRRLLRDVHAGGLRLPGDRLLARQERRHGRREDPHELLDRRRSCTGPSASPSPSATGDHHRARTGFFLRGLRRPAGGVRRDGPLRRDDRVEVVLPVRLLRRLAGDRLGHDARADQVRRLHHLRDHLRRVHLPDRLALGVRRRLAAGATSACRTSPARRRST